MSLRTSLPATLVILLVQTAHAQPASSKPKLVALDLQAAGVDAATAGALSEAVTTAVAKGGYFEVVSSKDVTTMLGLERQRQLLGCSEDATSCFAELAGALGARFVLSGTVARLGEAFQLTLQCIDSKTTHPLGRSTRIARTLDGLGQAIPFAVAEATATPPPPTPSRLGPYSMLIGGAGLLIGGGVMGLLTLNQETAVKKELEIGATDPLALKPVSYYRDQASQVSTFKTVSLATMIGGAALIAGGLYFYRSSGPVEVALLPTAGGVAVAGSWR